jgi:tripartite-type tricarboxylate transporter receptor subunit TctC
MHTLTRRAALLLAAALACTGTQVAAQAWPTRPVKVIVPYTPGTGIDILARTLGEKLGQRWGQSVVVENKPGASGNLGTAAAAKAPADGYTLVMIVNAFAINPSLYRNVPYNPATDFVPVASVATGALAVAINPALKAASMKDLVALSKAKPGGMPYGSPGAGTPQHMATELFRNLSGASLVHVPYKGSAGAVTDVLSGEVGLMFMPVHTALPFVGSGKLKVLAVASGKRSAVMPDVPTIAEAGYPGAEVEMWYGLLAPAGTPRELVTKLHADVSDVLQQQDVREKLGKQGLDPLAMSPEAFGAMIRADLARWAQVVKDANISAE